MPSATSRVCSGAPAGVSPTTSSARSLNGSRPATGAAATEVSAVPTDVVLVEAHGPVALVTLNRPEKLNALDYPLIDHLMAILDAIEADEGVRAVVLTGAGERAFSAGADIACFAPSVRRDPATA